MAERGKVVLTIPRLPDSGRKKWSPEEINIVTKHYKKYSRRGDLKLDNLAILLNRPKTGICRKARQLGFTIQKRLLNKTQKERLSKWAFKKGQAPPNKGKKLPEMTGKNNPFYGQHHTKVTRRKLSNQTKARFADKNNHPRGFLGHHRTEAEKEAMSKIHKKLWADPKSKFNSAEYREGISKRSSVQILKRMGEGHSHPYSNAKGGRRKDLGIYTRSAMEANYLRYLNFLKIKWEYEPKTFYFEGIKRGTLTYTPDIYLPNEDKWIEIKGWVRDKDKVKLKRFKRYFPTEFKKLTFVVSDPWGNSKSDIKMMKFLDELGIPLERTEGYKEIKQKLGALIPGWE